MGIDEVVDSGWTIETLKALMDERHRSQETALAREREERRERDVKNNEFRGQLADQASKFVTRVEMDAKLESLQQLIRSKNLQIVVSLSVGLGGLLIAVFNLATRLA